MVCKYEVRTHESRPYDQTEASVKKVVSALGKYAGGIGLEEFCSFVSSLEDKDSESLFGAMQNTNLPKGTLFHFETYDLISNDTIDLCRASGYIIKKVNS